MRLEITRKTDLAILALRMLAQEPETWTSDELATAVATTSGFLGQVLSPLVHAGWIHSTFGPGGGYRYTFPATPPSLLQVITAIEGPLREDECVLHTGLPCGGVTGGPVCALHAGWLRAREALLHALAGTSALATAAEPTPGHGPAAIGASPIDRTPGEAILARTERRPRGS